MNRASSSSLLRRAASHAAPVARHDVDVSAEIEALRHAHAGAFEALFGEPAPTHRVGKYELRREIGHGGAGVVYLAFDTELERNVALKLLDPSRASTEATRVGTVRLLREAKALARLSHPNVIEIFEVTSGPQLSIAMEYVDGDTLRGYARKSGAWRDILRKYLDAGTGLAAVNDLGLVHGDFKPENVLVSREGVVKVADFGIAFVDPRRVTPLGPGRPPRSRGRQPVGTPAYMAPEQYAGETVDAKADQFAFCVAVYEALVGRHPAAVARGLGANERAPYHGLDRDLDPREFERIVRAARRRLPRWLVDGLLRGMARAPEHRFESVGQLVARWRTRLERRSAARPMVLASVGMLAIASGLWASSSELVVARACHERPLAELWNGDTKARIEQQFSGSRRVHASSTWSRVQSRLDAFVREWTVAQRDTCRASARGDVDPVTASRRNACLTQSRDMFEGLLGHLEHADGRAVDLSVGALGTLRAPSSCLELDDRSPDLDAIAQASWPPELRRRFHEARHSVGLGRHGQALELAEALLASLDDHVGELEPTGLRAAVLGLLGEAHYEQGNTAEAKATLWQALEAGRDVADPTFSVGVWAHLVQTTDQMQGRPDEALALAKAARIDTRFADAPVHVRAGLWNAEALALASRGDLHESRAVLERVLAARVAHSGWTDVRVVDALTNLGNIERRLGLYLPARSRLERALEVGEAALGSGHPDLGYTHANLGTVALRLSEPALALAHFERVVALWTAAHGDRAPKVDIAKGLRALAWVELGRGDSAAPDLERALPAAKQAAPWYRAALLFALAKALIPTQPERARKLAADALDVADRASRDDRLMRAEIERWLTRPDHSSVRPATSRSNSNRLATRGRVP